MIFIKRWLTICIVLACFIMLFLSIKNKKKEDYVRNERPPVVIRGRVLETQDSYFLFKVKDNGEDTVKKVILDKEFVGEDSEIMTSTEKKEWLSNFDENEYVTIEVSQEKVNNEEIFIQSINNIK